MGLLFQLIGTGLICTLAINMGIIFAWPASTISLFASPNTTLNRPMTETEISLLGSLSSVGAIISTFCGGLLLDKLGRKNCALIISLCMVIFWLLLIVSKTVEVVLTSIFVSGIASAVILIGSVYISEISQDCYRGVMTAANTISYGIGMLLSYGLGGFLSYNVMLYVGLTLSVGGVGFLFLLKDSPIYLTKIGREGEAARAIAFYRNLKTSDKEVLEEMITIKSALNPQLDESTPEHERLQKDFKPAEKLSFWQFVKKSKSTRRALLVTMVGVIASVLQGLIVVQIYIEVLFTAELPSMSSTTGSILMAAIGVLAGVFAGYMTDIAGRRFLMIYASIATGVCCVVLGTQMHCHWGPSWITAVAIYAYTVTYTLGAGTVPYILLTELFLPEVKSIISMLIMELAWICNFLVLFIINPLLNALGWGPVFYIFAAMSFLTSAFCAFFLPETKGLTVNEIQLPFLKKKRENHC